MSYTSITVRLPLTLTQGIHAYRARLKALCGGIEPSFSDVVRQLLAKGLEAVEEKDGS